MLNCVVGLLVALLVLPPSAIVFAAVDDQRTVVASALADESGKGSMNIPVNSSLDSKEVADEIRGDVELRQANADIVEPDIIQEGTVRIDFSNARPGSTVEALLTEETRRRVLGLFPAAGAGGALAGTSAPYVALGTVAVVGGVLGGLAASGFFKKDHQKAATTSR